MKKRTKEEAKKKRKKNSRQKRENAHLAKTKSEKDIRTCTVKKS